MSKREEKIDKMNEYNDWIHNNRFIFKTPIYIISVLFLAIFIFDVPEDTVFNLITQFIGIVSFLLAIISIVIGSALSLLPQIKNSQFDKDYGISPILATEFTAIVVQSMVCLFLFFISLVLYQILQTFSQEFSVWKLQIHISAISLIFIFMGIRIFENLLVIRVIPLTTALSRFIGYTEEEFNKRYKQKKDEGKL